MTRGGWVAIGLTVLFFAACTLLACLIDWPNLAR